MNDQEINGEAFDDLVAATNAQPSIEKDEFAGDYRTLRIGHTMFTAEL